MFGSTAASERRSEVQSTLCVPGERIVSTKVGSPGYRGEAAFGRAGQRDQRELTAASPGHDQGVLCGGYRERAVVPPAHA